MFMLFCPEAWPGFNFKPSIFHQKWKSWSLASDLKKNSFQWSETSDFKSIKTLISQTKDTSKSLESFYW